MNTKLIQQTIPIVTFALTLMFSPLANAGGNTGQMMGKFEPIKTAEQIQQLNPGDTVVKVCRSCDRVTLVRVTKPGKGIYDYIAKKCEDCGSENTCLAVSKQEIPFKEREKR